MSKKSLPEQFRRNTAVALIACLLVLLWLPALDYFFGLDHSPQPTENRALAKFPTRPGSLAEVHDFPAGLENYFRDNFGFRNRLIRWERRWKHDLFKESASPDVLAGQNGWLYFSGSYMVEHFEGLKKFSPEELQNWQALLEKRRDWLARRSIKYLFVIPPDKHSIYPEFLPEWLAQRGTPGKLDQFLAHMQAHSTVAVLDLRPALRDAGKTGVTYLQNDSHWNTYGALVAYQALISALIKQVPDLHEPLPLTAFKLQPLHKLGGDLVRMLGELNPPKESNAIALIPRPPLSEITTSNAPERLRKKWLPGTEPILTRYDEAPGKAIVFRDSFAVAWYPLLGYHFHEVLYIWQYEWNTPFLEREKPTVVIDEMLERMFYFSNPLVLLQKDGLP